MGERLNYARLFRILRNILIVVIALVLFFWAFGSTTQQDEASWLEELRAQGLLRIGVTNDLPPFGQQQANGDIVGLEADLAKMIAREILGSEADAQLIPVDERMRNYALSDGDVQLCIDRFYTTEDRQGKYALTQSYMQDGIGILCAQRMDGEMVSLQGKRIGVLYKSVAATRLSSALEEKSVGVTPIYFASYEEIRSALQAGAIDCWIDEMLVLDYYGSQGMWISQLNISPLAYVVAGDQDNKALISAVNALLQRWEQDGTMQGLRDKYGVHNDFIEQK